MNKYFNNYEAFVDKFKAKKTTDDCYTPQWLYDTVVKYINDKVCAVDASKIVRPFWPGADYKAYGYKPDEIVIDNPPFSIIAQVVNFYIANNVRFWLWAPALTLAGLVQCKDGVTGVVCGESVTYENGAKVPTSFVSNLYHDRRRIHVAGELNTILKEGELLARKESVKTRLKYDLPDGVVTAARLHKIANAGVELIIKENETIFIRDLESQKKAGKKMFGAGWLLSREAAAREAAAREAAAREVVYWELSEKEKKAIDAISICKE